MAKDTTHGGDSPARQDLDSKASPLYIPIDSLDNLLTTKSNTRIERVKSKGARRKSATAGRAAGRGKEKEQGSIADGARVTKARARSVSKKAEMVPLDIETAIPRRMDWTPPQLRRTSTIDLTSGRNTPDAGDVIASPRQFTLRGALGGFGYDSTSFESAGSSSSLERQGRPDKPPLKRRKLEMVEVASKATNTPSAKAAGKPAAKKTRAKAPKKKPQTITELATKDYLPIVAVDTESLMDSFLSQAPANDTADGDDEGRDKLGEVMEEAKKRKTVKVLGGKKGTVRSRLLSPERALEAVDCQDFLFGTSSQLVREESPSVIRDIQYALKESEVSAAESQEESTPQAQGSDRECSLWGAATRDLDGTLLEAEVVEFKKPPRLPVVPSGSHCGSGAFQAASALCAPSPKPDLAPSPGTFLSDSPEIAKMLAPSPAPVAAEEAEEVEEVEEVAYVSLPKSMAEVACRERPRSKSPVKKSPAARKDSSAQKSPTKPKTKKQQNAAGESATDPNKIDYNKWTVAELSKKIKSYGFKPVKGKSAMVTLLEKCSASIARREALQSLSTNDKISPHFPPPSKSPAVEGATAAKPKGRRKSKSAAADVVADGGDVGAEENADAAPKKRGRPRKVDQEVSVAVAESVPGSEAVVVVTPRKASRTKPRAGKSSLEAPPGAILVTSSPPTAVDPGGITRRASAEEHEATLSELQVELRASRSIPAASGFDQLALTDDATTGADGVGVSGSMDPNSALLAAMTRAIMSSPPTHDPKNLSWREKMLIYDPIVLEDLAIWLNTEGLDRVGVDEEVWPSLVRQWCEERSICCLWRENLRGGTRSRH